MKVESTATNEHMRRGQRGSIAKGVFWKLLHGFVAWLTLNSMHMRQLWWQKRLLDSSSIHTWIMAQVSNEHRIVNEVCTTTTGNRGWHVDNYQGCSDGIHRRFYDPGFSCGGGCLKLRK